MKASMRAAAGLLSAVLILLMVSCGGSATIGISMRAIRCTDPDGDPVNLSLWLYGENGRLVGHTFTSGGLDPELQKDRWRLLDEADYIRVPRRLLEEGAVFRYVVKLNPNRLLTPPDAVFRARVSLDAVRQADESERTVVLRSEERGIFELRAAYCVWGEDCP